MSGVTLFFFISGFIITRLMLAEPSVQLLPFYVRRLFRLFPTLLAFCKRLLGSHDSVWTPARMAGCGRCATIPNELLPICTNGLFRLDVEPVG